MDRECPNSILGLDYAGASRHVSPRDGGTAIDSRRHRAQLSEALGDIDMRIHSLLGPDEIMQSALDAFVEVLEADAGDIKTVDGDEWIVQFECGLGPEAVGLRLTETTAPVASRVAAARQAIAVPDLLEFPDDYTGFPKQFGLRSVLAMPLVIRGEVIGCLFAWMKGTPRVFTKHEVAFAGRMAASVALALENARLFESVQEARRRAEAAEEQARKELARTTVLLHASDQLTSTTDVDELLQRLAAVVIEATGITRGFVNLIDADAEVLIPKVATAGLAAPVGRRIPFDELSETSRKAIASRRTSLLDYELPDLPEADKRIAEANGARLVLFVPLLFQDQVIGHITLDEPNARYDFTTAQIRIVESIAAQAAIAIRNAQAYEREHRIAQTLQEAILSPPDEVSALEIACLYQPASAAAAVGGDFYDVLNLGDDHAALLIGDVSGKGIQAAKMTALIRDGIRAYLQEYSDPATIIAKVNALAYRFMPTEKFATAFLGILDCSTGSLLYSGAGHPSPVVLGESGTRRLKATPGMLGAFKESTFELHSTALEPAEMLVLVTDGVTEARCDHTFLGDAGLEAILGRLRDTSVADMPHALLNEVLDFSGGRLSDDVVILCVQRASD